VVAFGALRTAFEIIEIHLFGAGAQLFFIGVPQQGSDVVGAGFVELLLMLEDGSQSGSPPVLTAVPVSNTIRLRTNLGARDLTRLLKNLNWKLNIG
jgi:hypothetical protein